MRDQELILRFLALYFRVEQYSRPLKAFLNSYMGANRHFELQGPSQVSEAFLPTISLVFSAIGPKAFKPKRALNAAVFDAVMVGVARRLSRGHLEDVAEVARRYAELLGNEAFVAATERSTTDEESVRKRLEAATEAFAPIR
jgi:hypothetical protein